MSDSIHWLYLYDGSTYRKERSGSCRTLPFRLNHQQHSVARRVRPAPAARNMVNQHHIFQRKHVGPLPRPRRRFAQRPIHPDSQRRLDHQTSPQMQIHRFGARGGKRRPRTGQKQRSRALAIGCRAAFTLRIGGETMMTGQIHGCSRSASWQSYGPSGNGIRDDKLSAICAQRRPSEQKKGGAQTPPVPVLSNTSALDNAGSDFAIHLQEGDEVGPFLRVWNAGERHGRARNHRAGVLQIFEQFFLGPHNATVLVGF